MMSYPERKTLIYIGSVYVNVNVLMLKNHTIWGGTYLYTLYRGVPPWGSRLPSYHNCKWDVQTTMAG